MEVILLAPWLLREVPLCAYTHKHSLLNGNQGEDLILLFPLQSMMHGKYHLLTKNLRDFVIHSIKEQHSWQAGNVEQLVMRVSLNSKRSVCYNRNMFKLQHLKIRTSELRQNGTLH